jgi:sec-independent protein translocase protein TatB
MFDIGWTEILIIAVVAIIVVGPKDLPRMLRSLGRYAGQLRRTAGEFRSQFDEAIRESELDELRSTLSDVSDLNPINQIRDSMNESMTPLKEAADDIKGSIEAPQAAGDDGSEEKPEPKKKAAAKPKAKPKPKAETTAAKSGGEG